MTEATGAPASQVRAKLTSAWTTLHDRQAGGNRRLDAIQLDPLHVSGRPLLAALDSDGRHHLLVPLPTRAVELEDSRSAGVQLTPRTLERAGGLQRYADLVCLRPDLIGVFSGLAADVAAAVIGSPEPSTVVARKLNAWRELLETPPLTWSSGRVAGLFAELLVLRSLLELDPSATTSWSGPFGEAQDFRLGSEALEIKATLSPETRMISVHGWDQLEPPSGGHLTLGWFRLRAHPDGDTVSELVGDCLQRANAAGDVRTRLDRLAIPDLDAEPLAVRIKVVEERWYTVGPDFPTVVPARFANGHVPTGVVSLDYRVDLDGLRPSRDDRAAILRRFVERT
ncbi:PD-(D/E)XK motif protein [Cellulomonas citrea]|uniref:PD-(D/E)XK motif protein n=1 Tax=Cellulomonas citrea TaxID=1909423 RepID=UPI0013576A14|nr:PD-(D/E)XK motif protein [Cellulomonas citrea]